MAPVEIPKRALFRASEVCEIAQLQPYVLRSWESEFPALGVAKSSGSPRMYRRRDVERVLRIKHLLFVDGLTLAGARRRLTEEIGGEAEADDGPTLEELIGQNARQRLGQVKQGLLSILQLLNGGRTVAVAPAPAYASSKSRSAAPGRPAVAARPASSDRGKPSSNRAKMKTRSKTAPLRGRRAAPARKRSNA